MVVIKEVDVVSVAKIVGCIGFLFGIIIAIISLLFAGAYSSLLGVPSQLAGAGAVSIILIPLFYLVGGFIFAFIFAWLYNLLSKKYGGIQIQLVKNELTHIDPTSTGKIYAIVSAILVLIVGVIAVIGVAAFGGGAAALIGILGIILAAIVSGVIIFIIVAIFAVLYNVIASKVGGIMLYFKGKELVKMGVLSYAKIDGIFGAIYGFVAGIIIAIVSISIPASASSGTMMAFPTLLRQLGLLSIIVFPILQAVSNFLSAGFNSFVYNKISSKVGNAKITFSKQ